tara:strand:- start:266 stop:490 length:225 start_codon:yes stop_codon:yes gene_type:complete
MSKNKFVINGSNYSCKLENLVLLELVNNFLREKNINSKNIAVALNYNLVKRANWEDTKICENDKIEIVVPFSGG